MYFLTIFYSLLAILPFYVVFTNRFLTKIPVVHKVVYKVVHKIVHKVVHV